MVELVITIGVVLSLIYLSGSVIVFGIEFAYWNNEYKRLGSSLRYYTRNRRVALVSGLFWPLLVNEHPTLTEKYKSTGIKFK
jgi:hypothetical protein